MVRQPADGATSGQPRMFDSDAIMDHDESSSEPRGANHASSEANDRYVVVARRYRPQSFEELVGQEHVRKALANAIETNRVGHAYLFAGPRGTGKTTTARIFAKALNCVSGPTMTPCNQCDICRDISDDADVDVIEIDGASNNGVNEIRALRENCIVRPARCRYKIYIIDEVHMLSGAAFNALLKTLEEPPEHVKFMLCTTDPDKLPITVLSRCQRFDLSAVEEGKIFDRLKYILAQEQRQADDAAVAMLARRAYGSLRDSQSLLEQLLSFSTGEISVDDVHHLLGTTDSGNVLQLLEKLAARDASGALAILSEFWLTGAEPERLSEQILGVYRDLLSASVGCDQQLMQYTQPSEFSRVQELANRIGKHTLLASLEIMQEMLRRIQATTKVRVLVETAIVRLASLEELDQLERWLNILQSPEMKDFARSNLVITPGGGMLPNSESAQKKSDLSSQNTGAAATDAGSLSSRGEQENRDDLPEAVEARTKTTALAQVITAPANVEVDGGERATEEFSSSEGQPNGSAHDIPTGSHIGPPDPASSTAQEAADQPPGQEIQPEGAITVTNQNVLAVWQRVCQSLDDLTASALQFVDSVAISMPNHLVVKFPSHYTFQKDACERPERRAKLEDEFFRTTGNRFRITFELLPQSSPTRVEEQDHGVKTTRQRRREAEQHPMVQQAMETFGAEVVRVDQPRRRS